MKLDEAFNSGKEDGRNQAVFISGHVKDPSTALELARLTGPAIPRDAHWAAAFSVEDWKEFLRAAAWDDDIHVRLYGHIRPDSRERSSAVCEIGMAVERFSHSEKQVYEQAMDALVKDAVNELPVHASAEVLETRIRPIRHLLLAAQITKSGPSPETLQSIATNLSVPLALRVYAAMTVGELTNVKEYPADFWTRFDYEKEPQFLNPCMFFFTKVKQPHVALSCFVACAEHALRAMQSEDDQFFERTLIFCTSYAIEMVNLLDPQVSLKELKGILSQESHRVFEVAERESDKPHRRASVVRRLS